MHFAYIILLALIIVLVVAWLVGRGRVENRAIKDRLRAINGLPIDEARKKAMDLLDAKHLFLVSSVEPVIDARFTEPLPRTVAELARRYATIRMTAPPFINLDLNAIQKSKAKERFLRLGKGAESSDTEYELCVLPDEEFVYEVFADGEIDNDFGRYTSVFHLIIAAAEEQSMTLKTGRSNRQGKSDD